MRHRRFIRILRTHASAIHSYRSHVRMSSLFLVSLFVCLFWYQRRNFDKIIDHQPTPTVMFKTCKTMHPGPNQHPTTSATEAALYTPDIARLIRGYLDDKTRLAVSAANRTAGNLYAPSCLEVIQGRTAKDTDAARRVVRRCGLWLEVLTLRGAEQLHKTLWQSPTILPGLRHLRELNFLTTQQCNRDDIVAETTLAPLVHALSASALPNLMTLALPLDPAQRYDALFGALLSHCPRLRDLSRLHFWGASNVFGFQTAIAERMEAGLPLPPIARVSIPKAFLATTIEIFDALLDTIEDVVIDNGCMWYAMQRRTQRGQVAAPKLRSLDCTFIGAPIDLCVPGAAPNVEVLILDERCFNPLHLLHAKLVAGHIGDEKVTQLKLFWNQPTDTPAMVQSLTEVFGSPTSSLRNLQSLTIESKQFSGGEALGRLLLAEGLCPRLAHLHIVLSRHSPMETFFRGAMHADPFPAAVHLETLTLRFFYHLHSPPPAVDTEIFSAMGRSMSGPFSRLKTIEVSGNHALIQIFMASADAAAAGACVHDWTASITKVGIEFHDADRGILDELATWVTKPVLPELRQMWMRGSPGFGYAGVQNALLQSYRQGLRKHKVVFASST